MGQAVVLADGNVRELKHTSVSDVVDVSIWNRYEASEVLGMRRLPNGTSSSALPRGARKNSDDRPEKEKCGC